MPALPFARGLTSGRARAQGENAVKNPNSGRAPRQPFVQADHHQPPSARSLLVQLVELVDHLLFVGGRVEAG
jgi:hypothetical protein